MIATTTPMFIVLALGCLILNFYAFRSGTEAAGHGTKQKLQMVAIWVSVLTGLTLLISLFQP
jgi:hypothetical protein